MEEAFSAACRQESEMDQYQEEKKALMRRPTSTYQRLDVKKRKSSVSSSETTSNTSSFNPFQFLTFHGFQGECHSESNPTEIK